MRCFYIKLWVKVIFLDESSINVGEGVLYGWVDKYVEKNPRLAKLPGSDLSLGYNKPASMCHNISFLVLYSFLGINNFLCKKSSIILKKLFI